MVVHSIVVLRRTDVTGKRSDRELSRAIKLTKTYDSPSLANQARACMYEVGTPTFIELGFS